MHRSRGADQSPVFKERLGLDGGQRAFQRRGHDELTRMHRLGTVEQVNHILFVGRREMALGILPVARVHGEVRSVGLVERDEGVREELRTALRSAMRGLLGSDRAHAARR